MKYMEDSQFLDTLWIYWPGGQELVPCVIELSLSEAIRSGRRMFERDGIRMPVLGHSQEHGDLCVHLRVTVSEGANELERRLIADTVWLRGWHLDHH